MVDYGRYPAGYGYEWRGDWRARLHDLLVARGFQRLTDFVNTRPTATLDTLANELGSGDVAPIQVQWVLAEEAKAADQLERCARDLLCRHLHEVQGGWPASRDWDVQEGVRHALIAWEGSLKDERYEPILERITTAMLDEEEIAPGWLPSNADDPIIIDLFERFWPRAGANQADDQDP